MNDVPNLRLPATNWLQAAVAIAARKSPRATARFGDVVQEPRLELVPVSVEAAYRGCVAGDYDGRSHHPAKLKNGDCLAYALGKLYREPLLFARNDSTQTDVEPALKD
jgi:uncharacterized protein with PIN domain